MAELGFPLIAISPDRPEKMRATMGNLELTYALYSDSTLAAAKAFGIVWQAMQDLVDRYKEYGLDLEDASGLDHHQLPVPSVFLIEQGGTIRWVHSDPNYRVRPENDLLLEAAKEFAR